MLDKLRVITFFKKKLYRYFVSISSKTIKKDCHISKCIIYPTPTDANLYIFLNKLNWYLKNNIEILLLSDDTTNSSYSKSLEQYGLKLKWVDIKQFRVALKEDNVFILVNNYFYLFHPYLIQRWDKIKIIDPKFYSYVESFTLQSLLFECISTEEKEKISRNSTNNFKNMVEKFSSRNNAYCYVTGPSFDNYNEYNFDKESIQIICNSIVKNRQFIEYIGGVDILCFGDSVFHFGASKYAEVFRRDVVEAIEKYKCYVIIPDTALPLFYYEYPSFIPYLIGVKSEYEGGFNIPSPDNLWLFNTGNVLSFLMIPIASALVNNVVIFGADGRQKKEKYFWQHSKTSQYTDLMNTVFEAHPSFFRDRSYLDYYLEHCESLRKLLEFGEIKGIKYLTLTKSFIPALRERYG